MAVTTSFEQVRATQLAAGTSGLHRGWTLAINRAIGWVVDPIAALLIIVEVGILASGVFSRYVLHNALTWTDELGTILFLWLTMLGAVMAYQRRQHMRLTAVLRYASPALKEWLDIIAATIVGIFCLELLPASGQFLKQEVIDLTPALSIPRSDVVLAIVAGLSLILVVSILRLIDSDWKKVAIVLVSAAIVCGGFYEGRAIFAGLGNWNLIVFFVLVVGACVAIGVPIAFSFGIGSVSYLALTTSIPMSTVVGRMDEGVENLVLLAIPLFVLLGVLMESTGIARRLVDALASLFGHFSGGLNIVLVAAMYVVSGISGSKTADMAAVAPTLFPDMEKRGQKRPEMIALLATSGAMAETIPPSLVLIIIGTVTTGVSIGELFKAGLLPALVSCMFLLAVSMFRTSRQKVTLGKRASLRQIGRAFFVAIPGLLLPFVIRYCVVYGVTTATEVSTIGIIWSLLVGIIVYREFDWTRAYPMLKETATLSGSIMLIIATATAMGWSLTQSGFANQLATMLSQAGGPVGFWALSIAMFIFLGSVLEGIPAMVLFGPLLFPIAHQFQIDEVQYAMVAVLSMGVGLFAPPLGIGFYGACVIGKADPDTVIKPMIPYLFALVASVVVIAAFPQISLCFLHRQ